MIQLLMDKHTSLLGETVFSVINAINDSTADGQTYELLLMRLMIQLLMDKHTSCY